MLWNDFLRNKVVSIFEIFFLDQRDRIDCKLLGCYVKFWNIIYFVLSSSLYKFLFSIEKRTNIGILLLHEFKLMQLYLISGQFSKKILEIRSLKMRLDVN